MDWPVWLDSACYGFPPIAGADFAPAPLPGVPAGGAPGAACTMAGSRRRGAQRTWSPASRTRRIRASSGARAVRAGSVVPSASFPGLPSRLARHAARQRPQSASGRSAAARPDVRQRPAGDPTLFRRDWPDPSRFPQALSASAVTIAGTQRANRPFAPAPAGLPAVSRGDGRGVGPGRRRSRTPVRLAIGSKRALRRISDAAGAAVRSGLALLVSRVNAR